MLTTRMLCSVTPVQLSRPPNPCLWEGSPPDEHQEHSYRPGPQEHPQRAVPAGTGVAPLETTERSPDEQRLLTPRLVATGRWRLPASAGPGTATALSRCRWHPRVTAPLPHGADSRHEALEQRERLRCVGT